MKIEVIKEEGYEEALLGLSLSWGQSVEKMSSVAERLCDRNNGEAKFLESISVWLSIKAPRYWWQEFATYRTGISSQSESTLHTLMKHPLMQEDFQQSILPIYLDYLNNLIEDKEFEELKNALPEGYLQRRIVCLNYKTLRNMLYQRKNHRLYEWQSFCAYLKANLKHPELLKGL